MNTKAAGALALLGLALVAALGTRHAGDPAAAIQAAAGEEPRSGFHTPTVVAADTCALPPGTGIEAFPDSLLAGLQDETDPCQSSEAIQRAADSVPDVDLRSVLDALVAATNSAATELCQLLTRRWAERDLPAATSWTEQLADSAFQSEALRQVALAWASTDLAGATEWVRTLPEDLNKTPALAGVAYEACRTDPLVGLDLMLDSPPGPERDDFLVHALSQWAGVDSAAAWHWAAQVPDPALRRQFLAAIALAIAEREGAAAAELVATSLPAGPDQERAAVAVAQRWAAAAPREAASWTTRFPDAIRATAVQNVVTLWKDQDSAAAGAWLETLPENLRAELGHPTTTPIVAEFRN